MYRVNIFINSMLKSAFCRAPCLILMYFTSVLPAVSAGFQDTVGVAETIPDPDSTMIRLNDLTFNSMLDGAIDYQQRADSLHRLSVEWRKEAAKMDDQVLRGRLQRKILQVEDSVEIYRALANEHFEFLNASIPEEAKEEPRHPFLVRDTVLNGITVYRYNLTEEFMALLEEIRQPALKDNQAFPADQAENVPTKKQSGFRIFNTSPYGPGNPFERDFSIPPGVFYRIQLAVFSKKIARDHFGGLSPITTESIPGRDMTRYFVGKFTRMEDARTSLVKVRAQGYPDAFIIGYYDGRKGSFSKLKALEK